MAQKTEFSFYFKQLPSSLEGLKLVHLTDLHMGFWTSPHRLKKIIDKITEFKPDIICFTGDFLIRSRLKKENELFIFLNSLKAPYCFATLGNHDYNGTNPHEKLVSLLSKTSFKLLHNETCLLKSLGLQIVGLGDIKASACLPKKAFEEANQEIFTLVLTHNPDTVPQMEGFRKDLILAGHTHGGQINLPLVWNFHTRLKNKEFKRGLVKHSNWQMYVNRGLGRHTLFRLFSPPELLFARLERE